MEQVASHLADQAIARRRSPPDADCFGRSAFNRYYYTVYLEVRAMLADFEPAWSRSSHRSIPQLLCGAVKEEIQKAKRKAATLRDGISVSICSDALRELPNLAELLRSGYLTRSIADYDPGVPILFDDDGKHFSLSAVKITTAQQWVARARFMIAVIRRGWKLTDAG